MEERKAEIAPVDTKTELEILKTKQQIIEAQKDIQIGWQDIVKENLPKILEAWKESSTAEYRGILTLTKWTFWVVIAIYVVLGGLAFLGKISGESLVFMTGTIVGYILSLVSARFKKEPES